jgi:hypothetical protein
MAAEIHVGDIGTRFTATIVDADGAPVNVASATLTMVFQKPNGAVVTRVPALVTTGVDGKIVYTTIANDLDVAGPWQVQAYAVMAAGSWHTDVHRFPVSSNLT